MLMDTANAKSFSTTEESLFGDLPGWVAPAILLILVLLVISGMIVLNKTEEAIEVETMDWTKSDQDIEAVVEDAALLD